MKKTMKRAVAAVAVAAGIAGGSMAAAGEAQAATGPGDLALFGGVNCYWKNWGPTWDNLPGWRMHRWISVRNIGGATMHNVTITELGGAAIRVPARTKAQAIAAGAVPSTARNTVSGELLPGQAFQPTQLETTWVGCWPSSISGYTIGSEVENPTNNFGFWANVQQAPGNQQTVPDAPSGTT